MINKVPLEELQEQRDTALRLRKRLEGKRYHIVTFGCQMNAHESESLGGMLQEMGLTPAPERWDADVVLFNTCCIRDSAERRLMGNIGKLCQHKLQERQDMLIGVCGCMTQQQDAAQRLMKRYPQMDFVMGTQGVHKLPSVLEKALNGRVHAVTEDERVAEGQPVVRSSAHAAYVNIMYGCDNYCSYCIVPYVRGRERSREAADIIAEAEALAKEGVREITLLGQNVNSYSAGMDFAGLLTRLDGVVPRIRFMTSHPKDLSEALIRAMTDSRSAARHLHLPAQSGSDRVLSAMNRRYTRAHYLKNLSLVRQAMPDIGITTDLIVGFPGESEEDFEQTLELMELARYDAAYTFKYSPRKGTRAASMEGQIPQQVKEERLARLIHLHDQIQAQVYSSLVGKEDLLLVEGPSRRGDGVTGRIGRGITVNVPDQREAGMLIPVKIIGAKHRTLYGEWGEET